MARGKNKCRILKQIRKQIADANDIHYVIEECKFKGDCTGTCPKCEAEVRYLEEQLEERRVLGKAVALVGVSAGIAALSSCGDRISKQPQPLGGMIAAPTTLIEENEPLRGKVACPTEEVGEGTDDPAIRPMMGDVAIIEETLEGDFDIQGTVVDENGEPVAGCLITIDGTETKALADDNGHYTIKAKKLPANLYFSFIGCKEQLFRVTAEAFMKGEPSNVVLSEDDPPALTGEVAPIPPKKKKGRSRK